MARSAGVVVVAHATSLTWPSQQSLAPANSHRVFWLHGATGRRRWARGARWATTWASVRGVRGEVCYTLLVTNPSPRASRPPPPGKRWCHGPAVLDRSYATISSSIICFDALASHVHYGYHYCCCCCCYCCRYRCCYCCAGPLRQVRTGCDGGHYGDDGRRLRGQGGFGASTEQHGQAISGTTSRAQDELRGCRRSGLRRRRVRDTPEVRGQQKRGRDGAERHRFLYKTVGPELGSPV